MHGGNNRRSRVSWCSVFRTLPSWLRITSAQENGVWAVRYRAASVEVVWRLKATSRADDSPTPVHTEWGPQVSHLTTRCNCSCPSKTGFGGQPLSGGLLQPRRLRLPDRPVRMLHRILRVQLRFAVCPRKVVGCSGYYRNRVVCRAEKPVLGRAKVNDCAGCYCWSQHAQHGMPAMV